MKKRTIVVLEDDQDLRDLYALILEDYFDVKSFETIQSFNEGLLSLSPSLFLLDVALPDGNGIDVCKKLRATSTTNTIPVIILSAHANPDTIQSNCEADAFFKKPFDINHLIATVENLAIKTD